MSKIREILELKAPSMVECKNEEYLKSAGHMCPCCQGNGFFWKREGKDYVKGPCPVCHGKGTVTAYITIEWKGEE